MRLIEKTAVDAVCEKYENHGLSNGTTLGYHSGIVEIIISELESLPTIEAEPVRHGRCRECAKFDPETKMCSEARAKVISIWVACGRFEEKK